MSLNNTDKLRTALQQIRNVEIIAEDLMHSRHILKHTNVVKYELQRQLALSTAHPDDLTSDT